ncbi:hypothetical protein TrVE_jg2581 [Triparma verrucosa]|uniref:Glycosyltransferase 2-like domain-containing protein n=1 Tax=Triparma verrucosa TaxID=1606542 RepID=A0A9W7KVU0_9STRA|nr:hypothetical protein TrVE_jg2581 [Triparma verrucosa]
MSNTLGQRKIDKRGPPPVPDASKRLRLNDDGSPLHTPPPHLPAVDVIVPAHNCESTIEDALSSAYFQSYCGLISILVYDDCSSDDTAARVSSFVKNHPDTPCRRIKLVAPTTDEPGGAGFARNSASKAGTSPILVLLDSDDVMMRQRVEKQVAVLTQMEDSKAKRTIVGCNFYREPEGSTQHYTNWANTLTPERIYLEQFRELTLLQPTWCLHRARFEELDGYTTSALSVAGETEVELKLAEDLRFWHAHLSSPPSFLVTTPTPEPLLMYRHLEGMSQSSRTSPKLLMNLRLKSFESRVLNKDKWKNGFAVWGAGRDGKNFVKNISVELRKNIRVMVDVDEKKINAKFYFNRDLNVKIPIAHFSSLQRGGDYESLPVVVCVAMYRTDGKLEENVSTIERKEGDDLWHFF